MTNIPEIETEEGKDAAPCAVDTEISVAERVAEAEMAHVGSHLSLLLRVYDQKGEKELYAEQGAGRLDLWSVGQESEGEEGYVCECLGVYICWKAGEEGYVTC